MARRSSGRRTDYTWNGAQVGGPLAANAQSAFQIVGPLGTAGTIMRNRGELICALDGPSAGDAVTVFFGLIVVTEEQLAVGVTAIPNPGADFDADWLWIGTIPLLAQGAVEDQAGTSGRLIVDSKAMRRIKQSQSVALACASSVTTGTPAIDFEGFVRTLFGA